VDKLYIDGPAKLNGSVRVSRAKNAYLPIIAGVLLNPRKTTLINLPELRDIITINKLLSNLGVEIKTEGHKTIYDTSKFEGHEATYDLVKTMRASILVLGPLLARFKKAKVSLPGGCAIGARPIDIHLENLKKMGAKIELESGYVYATTEGLKGAKCVLPFPSVGATENLMMAAVGAEGTTIIENAALEPEIEDLGNFLIKMGAQIEGLNSSTITIKGRPLSELNEIEHEAIGDRIEALTYMMAALITDSEIEITGFVPSHLDAVIETLKKMNAQLEVTSDGIKVLHSKLEGITVETAPYPGFPTDGQAQLMALCTKVLGTSVITEKIFENRFMHVPELIRLGAKIELKGNTAIITGVEKLEQAPIMCTDLRASAALILAALASEGKTEIQRVYHLDRGYEKIDNKLRSLGVSISRINE
jgi:UDP-N-acetylglucosamine 1-carboxyvinyltransferase